MEKTIYDYLMNVFISVDATATRKEIKEKAYNYVVPLVLADYENNEYAQVIIDSLVKIKDKDKLDILFLAISDRFYDLIQVLREK